MNLSVRTWTHEIFNSHQIANDQNQVFGHEFHKYTSSKHNAVRTNAFQQEFNAHNSSICNSTLSTHHWNTRSRQIQAPGNIRRQHENLSQTYLVWGSTQVSSLKLLMHPDLLCKLELRTLVLWATLMLKIWRISILTPYRVMIQSSRMRESELIHCKIVAQDQFVPGSRTWSLHETSQAVSLVVNLVRGCEDTHSQLQLIKGNITVSTSV